MQIKFDVFWKKNLGTLYKDNSIDVLGKEAIVDLDLREVSNIHVNFKVNDKSFTDLVEIVDIGTSLIRIPFKTDVIKLGTNELELVATMKNGDVKPSQTFTYTVDKSLENPNAVEADTNYPVLIELMDLAGNKLIDMDESIQKVNTSIENMTNEISNYKEVTTNSLNSDISSYKETTTKELENNFNNYSNNTTSNITRVLDNKIVEVDNAVSIKSNELDTKFTAKSNEITKIDKTLNSEINKVNTTLTNKVNEVDRILENKVNEVDRVLDTTVTTINAELDKKSKEVDNKVNAKIVEIDNRVNAKITDVNTSLNNKINEVNEVIEEVELSEQARKEEHTELVNELSSYSSDMNNVKDRVDALEAKITDNEAIVDLKNKVNNHETRIKANENTLKHHDILLKSLNILDETISIENEEGTIISLPQSKDGIITIDELQGNTLVNYCTNGNGELTLNNEINVQGTNVTLTDTVDNGLVDVVCEGNTLTNSVYSSSIYNFKGTASISRGFNAVTLRCRPGKLNDIIYYRVNFTLNKLTTNAGDGIGIQTARDAGGYPNYIKNFKDCVIGQSEHVSAIRKIDENCLTLTNSLMLGCNAGVPSDCVSGVEFINFTLHDFVIINLTEVFGSGNEPTQEWCDENIPYFEGMKSAFELEDNKVEILSRNSHNEIVGNGVIGDLVLDPNGNLQTGGGADNFFSSDIFEVIEPNTRYYFWHSINGVIQQHGQYIYFYDENKKFIARKVDCIEYKSYSNARYLKMMIYRGGNTDIKFYVSKKNECPTVIDSKTKSNKKEIQLSEPLRGLPDGVCDKFVKQGGKWYVERNCGSVVLDGSENWIKSGPSSIKYYIEFPNLIRAQTYVNTIIADTMITSPNQNTNQDCISISGYYSSGNNTSNWMYINHPTIVSDVKGLKQWLSENPTKVVYQLATPTYEEITDPQLITYLDTTHISTNSTIPCNMQIKNSGYNAIIKPSTQYTVAFDTDKSGEVNIGLGGAKTSTTNNIATITTPNTLTDDTLRLYGKGIKASNVRLLEGDKANYIPSYFEGMKSCFEDKEQDNGSYKMEILSNNKNLATELIPYDSFGGDVLSTTIVKSEGDSMGCLFRVKPNTKYIFKKNRSDNRFRVFFFINNPIENPSEVSIGGMYSDGYDHMSLTSPYNARYCYLVVTGNYIDNPVLWYQAVEGNTNIDYIPHKSSSIQLQLNEPLRAVGDVKDRFVLKDGKLMIERNFAKVIFDGNEEWRSATSSTNTGIYRYYNLDIRDTALANGKMICDRFIVFEDKIPNTDIGTNNLISISTSGSNLYVSFANSSASELKKWLAENPTTVVYQLAEPIYEEVPYETQKLILECFENGTLFIDTNIPPTVSVTYSANKPVVAKLNQVDNVTNVNTEDIAITQMAVDFLLMSSLGEEMINFKIKGGTNMSAYFASRIIKGALKYEDVISKYPNYKEDIDLILIAEGYSDLIVEL